MFFFSLQTLFTFPEQSPDYIAKYFCNEYYFMKLFTLENQTLKYEKHQKAKILYAIPL